MRSLMTGGSRLFGTDGIRGTANKDLTPELAMAVGRAAVEVLSRNNPRPLLLVGRDTRISGAMLEYALTAGVCAAGGRVESLGVVPTPAVAFLTRKEGADAGVVISASHNPAEDNGIKFFHADGFKLPDEMEREIEKRVREREDGERPVGDKVGCPAPSSRGRELYLEHLLSLVDLDLSSLHLVVDCAHGSVCDIAPRLFRTLGAKVTALNVEPDGTNINLLCGSTNPQGLQRRVVEEGAHLGLAFDGDADRVVAVDEKGNLADGDFIMAVTAVAMKERGILKRGALAATVMSNLGFLLAMRREGIHVHLTPVGDRYVVERMLQEGLNLGGEQSGHIVFLDHATTGDGLLTSLMLLETMWRSGESLSALCGVMEKVPQVLLNVKVREKERLSESGRIKAAVRDWENRLGGKGRILLRPSGTEQVVRVMVEDVDPLRAEEAARELARVVEKELG